MTTTPPNKHYEDIEALMPNTGRQQPEEEKKESKLFRQNRNERTSFFSWGRLTCGKVVAFIVKLFFCCWLFKFLKRFIFRIIKCLYEALRDKENTQDLRKN